MAERAEHLEGNHDIDTLNQMDRERGLIDWDEVFNWFDGITTPGLKEKIAELLTGKTDGEIDAQNPDVQLLLYYLYNLDNAELNKARVEFLKLDEADQQAAALAITGDPNGEIDDTNPVHQTALMARFPHVGKKKFELVFDEIYKTRLDPVKKKGKLSVTLGSPGELVAQLTTFRNTGAKQESRDAALTNFTVQLGNLQYVAKQYGLTIPPEIQALTTAPDLAAAMRTVAIPTLQAALFTFFDDLEEKKEGVDQRILVRPIGPIAVYLCIRQEHALLGKLDKDLEEAAAEDFAKFAVYVTSVDFGGIRPVDPEHPITSGYRYDVQKAGATINPFEWLRKGGASMLSEFPVFEGINPRSDAHEIEHHFEKLGTKELSEFIALLRVEALKERDKGVTKGVARKNLTEISNLVRILEEMLAERMKKSIAEGEAKDAWKRAAAATRAVLRVPVRHVEHDTKKARIHLKGVRLPKSDGDKPEKKGLLEKMGAVGAIIAGTLHAIETVVNFIKGRPITGGAGKSDTKKEPPKGH